MNPTFDTNNYHSGIPSIHLVPIEQKTRRKLGHKNLQQISCSPRLETETVEKTTNDKIIIIMSLRL